MDAKQNPSEAGSPRLDLKLTRLAVASEPWHKLFFSNLRDFLTERPIKIRGGKAGAFFPGEFGASLVENFKEWLRPLPPSARQRPTSDLLLASQPWFRAFWENIRDRIAPRKLPPLAVTSEPVEVPELWSKNQQFTRVQALSFAFHVLVAVLVILPLLPEFMSPPTQVKAMTTTVIVSPYLAKLSTGNKAARGGGGRIGKVPATRGRLPRLALNQLTPPMIKPMAHPKLAVTPTVIVPPNIHMPNTDAPDYGDPLAKLMTDSMGSGSGTGIGNGEGSGMGPGHQFGVGGGYPEAGQNGYGTPTCLYCPDPHYSDAAFKLKIQGTVVLDVVITPDGRATDIHVSKGLGYGLDQEAIKAVRDIYRFKPAVGPDGRATAVHMLIEVEFHLY